MQLGSLRLHFKGCAARPIVPPKSGKGGTGFLWLGGDPDFCWEASSKWAVFLVPPFPKNSLEKYEKGWKRWKHVIFFIFFLSVCSFFWSIKLKSGWVDHWCFDYRVARYPTHWFSSQVRMCDSQSWYLHCLLQPPMPFMSGIFLHLWWWNKLNSW